MVVVVLAGCRLDVDVATVVAPDGSGTVRVTLTADGQLVAAVPGVANDLRLDDALAAGWAVEGPSPAEGGGSRVVLAKPFRTPAEATRVLAEVAGPTGLLRNLRVAQTAEFARVTTTFEGQVVLSGLDGFADSALVAALGGQPLADRVTDEQLRQGLGLTVRVELPGTVTGTNGTVDGSTVSWVPSLAPGAVTPLQATSVQVDQDALDGRRRESWATRALWIYAAVVGAVALAMAGVLLWRRRHRH